MKISSLIFDSKQKQIFEKLKNSFKLLEDTLAQLKDFCLSIKFKATSPIFPDFFLSKYKDDLRLTKVGKRIRLDFSLMPGQTEGEFLRSSQTLLFNCSNITLEDLERHNKIVLINREKKTFSTPFSKITLNEKKALLRDIFFKMAEHKIDFVVDSIKIEGLKARKQDLKGGLEK